MLAMAVQTAIRRIHTTVHPPRLTRFSLHAPKTVEVEFANGSVFTLSAEFLRVYSAAADGKIRSVGGEKVIFGRRHVGIMSAEPVGNYGVSLKAMAGGARGNLDHLQKQTLQSQQLPQKQRFLYVAPIEPLYRFPATQQIMEDPLDGYSRGRMPWAIREREIDYKVRFDMPGMTKNDVKVWIEENMLVFEAEKAQQQGQATGHKDSGSAEEQLWPAKSFGRYSCRIALPENIAFENIKAQVKDGVLYITIPKAAITSKILDIQVE